MYVCSFLFVPSLRKSYYPIDYKTHLNIVESVWKKIWQILRRKASLWYLERRRDWLTEKVETIELFHNTVSCATSAASQLLGKEKIKISKTDIEQFFIHFYCFLRFYLRITRTKAKKATNSCQIYEKTFAKLARLLTARCFRKRWKKWAIMNRLRCSYCLHSHFVIFQNKHISKISDLCRYLPH